MFSPCTGASFEASCNVTTYISRACNLSAVAVAGAWHLRRFGKILWAFFQLTHKSCAVCHHRIERTSQQPHVRAHPLDDISRQTMELIGIKSAKLKANSHWITFNFHAEDGIERSKSMKWKARVTVWLLNQKKRKEKKRVTCSTHAMHSPSPVLSCPCYCSLQN